MNDLFCFSHEEFDNECLKHGYSDSCVPDNIAFISIIGTEDCQKYYLEETEEHWFKDNHPGVLNLEFDDIAEDEIIWEGHRILGLSEGQAKEIVEFIDKNIGKDFWIHCRAGFSRSQAIVRYILDLYSDIEWKTRKDNPCLSPNIDVLQKLKRIKWNEARSTY